MTSWESFKAPVKPLLAPGSRVYPEGILPLRIGRPSRGGEIILGLGDKIKHAAEKAGGKAKEAAGEATASDRLKADGKTDQAKAEMKQAGDKIKDAFKSTDRQSAFSGRRSSSHHGRTGGPVPVFGDFSSNHDGSARPGRPTQLFRRVGAVVRVAIEQIRVPGGNNPPTLTPIQQEPPPSLPVTP
jgi:uncharacterized protein YjbJ (UPF0337 family)